MDRRGFIGRIGLVAASVALAPAVGALPYPPNSPIPEPELLLRPTVQGRFSLRAYLQRTTPLRMRPRSLLFAVSERGRILLLRGYDVFRNEGGWNVRGGHEPLYWCTHAVCVNEQGDEPMILKDRDGDARRLYAEVAESFPDWWSVDPDVLMVER